MHKDVVNIITNLDKPIRKGYYKMAMQQTSTTGVVIKYNPIVYVKEIDRYTNGESKIEIDRIEIHCGDSDLNRKNAETYINNDFISLVKTSDITWLESEVSIKEQRKEKLSRLKEIMK